MPNVKLFSGSSHPQLSQQISNYLTINLGKCHLQKFKNNETSVEIQESVRDEDVYIVQSGCKHANDYIIEACMMIQACKTASARHITALIPFFPYAKSHQLHHSPSSNTDMSPITAKLIANMLTTSGVDRILTMDLDAPQMQGFFDIPVDNLFAQPSIVKYIKEHVRPWQQSVIVAPNNESVKRAIPLAWDLDVGVAVVHGVRLVGEVRGKVAIIIDNILDTCIQISVAAQKLLQEGAIAVHAVGTHGVFSDSAISRLLDSGLESVIVTNTIPQEDNVAQCSIIKVMDVAPVFAEAVRRIHNRESVSYLFNHVPT